MPGSTWPAPSRRVRVRAGEFAGHTLPARRVAPGASGAGRGTTGERSDTMLRITEVRVSLRDDAKLKAFASITIEDCFVIRGLKVIEGNNNRMFVAMPSRKRPDGKHQDLAHPIKKEMRQMIEDVVIGEYMKEKSRGSKPTVLDESELFAE